MGLFGKLFGTRQPAPECAIHDDDRDLVRPEDIDWWNSLSLADCEALEKEDNVFRLAAFQRFLASDGLSDGEPGKRVRVSFPTLYSRLEHRADEKFKLGADDAKLPLALKDRINRGVMGRVIDKEAVNRSSSFNALVRQLIRAGRL